ncbi:lipoate-protein ligase A [Thermococcus onnurineus NA1]|uniref:lipoate--protein ligase n=1 Tax=Thermococcus onnurineus (strain NA1) TaxID=523850 RepID=B6YU49_THEON|nr:MULTISPECIES: lipoate protein ligase C-terminal domain-containing protein [Thermococcus]ACJ15991.1 lipoate-protein ligase A [Thermococcus onnurineus NA1]NJE46489.1 lipoate--protein ligase family protein [Thermococcus sp. GR7]NJE77591.1 lipoate--protein ligase family protein [Thermococcus sp. GR4]NJF23680.1 lipoate--protein ligase family protein [Thermococcus sp. GR5]
MKHHVGEHKAKKGLIRIEFDEEKGIAENVKITGDFFMHPEEAIHDLERELEGHRLEELEQIIDEFFAVRMDIEMPYVNVEDFKIALKNALKK